MSGKVFHAPFINEHPGFTLSGIVERHKRDSAEKYPNAFIYKSVEELLENDDISLIIINTPVQTHFEYAKKALEAGKNIIVEKPFTVNAKQAIELNSIAKEKNLFISVYQNRRFDRDFQQTKKIIESGVLGNLKEVEIRFDRFRTAPSGKIHKENPSLQGSGALHDLGAHLIDQAILLFGAPESVFGDVFSMKGSETANDYFEILMYYPNDFRLRIKSSVFTKEDHYSYKIFGDKGSFLQERTDNQEAELVSGSIPEYGSEWQISLRQTDSILNYNNDLNQNIRIELTSEPGNYMDYYQQIYEHQVFGYPIPSPASEIIDVMKTIDLVLKSSKERRVLDFKSY
jgi:predicted dehydrogenase